MSAKVDLIRPILLRSIWRLKTLVEMNAPALVIGAEAWMVFKTTLATYGSHAGTPALDQIRDNNLEARGVCAYDDCIASVDRGGSGVCPEHEKQLGIDTATLDQIFNERKT